LIVCIITGRLALQRAENGANAHFLSRFGIIRDARLTLESVYYPFLSQLLPLLPGDHAYLTLDQTNHGSDFNLVLVGWATDAVSLPLGFVVYGTDETWAEEARTLLSHLEQLIPELIA
jgi:hypothetical protein